MIPTYMQDEIYEVLFFFAEIAVIGAIFFGIEKLKPAEKNITFFKPGFKEELGLAFLNVSLSSPLARALMAGFIALTIQNIIPNQMFDEQISSLPLAIQIVFGCLILDFSTYWRHRFTHSVSWLWPFHSVHHAAQSLTWITSLRLHPVDILVAAIFDALILHLFGFSASGIIFSVYIIRAFNYFTHANINLQFDKPLRYIFASPNFHRWHHATEKSAYNKNFCSMFSFLDLIFGTYHHPEHLPKGYGLEDADQKEYPKGLGGWLAYPFKQLQKKLT